MKNIFKILAIAGLSFCASLSLSATELPVRYKSGSLNMTPRKNSDNWITTVDVRYGQTETRDGFNANSERTSALDIFGRTDLTRLGYGLEGLNAAMAATYPLWALGYAAPALTGGAGALDLVALQNLIKTTGRVSASELTLNIEQNLFSGFFGQCYIPFRQMTVDNIGYEVIGNQVMPAPANNVTNFVTTSLTPIMGEQGMEYPLSSYKKQAVSELVLGLGWQGFNNQGFGVIDDATGRIFVGAIIPGAGKQDTSYMTGFPLGYDGFWGVHTRLELEVGLKKVIALGAASSINIFFIDTRNARVMSDVEKKQTGILSFAQARVDVDQGAVWDVSAFAKLHKVFYGLTAQAGYSFSRQEKTCLTIKDNDYLKSAGIRYQAMVPPQFLSREDVINNDERLQSWERQMLHLAIGYDFSLHNPAPAITPYLGFEYGYPIDGQRVMVGKYLGGTASVQLKMLF